VENWRLTGLYGYVVLKSGDKELFAADPTYDIDDVIGSGANSDVS
jgi:hypothetical protein